MSEITYKGIGIGICDHEFHVRGCAGDCYLRSEKESSMDLHTQPTANQTVREPEMKTALMGLTGEVEALQNEMSTLMQKLAPVMRPDAPALEVQGDIEKMEAEYPDKVNNLAHAVGDQRRLLQGIVRRLEV